MRNSPRIRGILFDKDGTLFDYDATWLVAYRAAASELATRAGDARKAEELLRVGGYRDGAWVPDSVLTSGSNLDIATTWAPLVGRTDVDSVTEEIETIFHRIATADPVPTTDLPALLARLAANHLSLGIATMDSERTARANAATFGLTPFLTFICGADSGYGTKPTPGMVHGFCAATALTPDAVLVVGDSPHDLTMAKRSGASAVGVLTGAHDARTLAPLADLVIPDISHLPDALGLT